MSKNVGKLRMQWVNKFSSAAARETYQNLSKSFVKNSILDANLRTSTIKKMYNNLRSVKSNRKKEAIFRINKDLTKKIKADIRQDIREYAYHNRILIREARNKRVHTFGGVVKMFDRTEFWQRANADQLGSKAWEYERNLAKREKRSKLRTIQQQAEDLFNNNIYAQKINEMREKEMETRNNLRIKLFRKM